MLKINSVQSKISDVEKLIFIAEVGKMLSDFLNIGSGIKIYRSKGLMAHLLKRNHFVAAKYIDFIPEIIEKPDFAGGNSEKIELVKCFKDSIFLSVKLDVAKQQFYVSTMFEVKKSKIDSYCASGRLRKLDNQNSSNV